MQSHSQLTFCVDSQSYTPQTRNNDTHNNKIYSTSNNYELSYANDIYIAIKKHMQLLQKKVVYDQGRFNG